MKKTNPIFSLKNFRSFGDEGADFELAPITILTGCNSAGKSSLVKALMLLSKQPTQEVGMNSSKYDIKRCLPPTELNINTKQLMLGQFDKVLHDKSESSTICFSYRIWSDYLQEVVVVKRIFIPKQNDVLNNGRLFNLIIEKIDGTQIYEINGHNTFPDEKEAFCTIEDNYNKFVRVIDFLEAKRKHSLILIGKKLHKISPQKIEETDQWLKKASDELKKNNIQVESYNSRTIKGWMDQYCNPLDKTQFDTILDKSCSKEEKEERKKNSFMSLLVNEVMRPWFTKDIEYINSTSALINRLYSGEDENKMSKSLRIWNERRNVFRNNDCFTDAGSNEPGLFLNKWIKKFKIGDSVEMEGTPEGLGLLVFLVQDGKRRLLADEGYGITQLVSLLLQIDNTIEMFIEPEDNNYLNQERFQYTYPQKVICVEEPEVHLHPKYQSLLAEMFVEAYQKYNIHFIIETHSEYLIRKLQVMVADKENTLTADDVSLNYIEKDENGVSQNRQIIIDEHGDLSEPFGSGFYDEADALAIQLFRNKPIRS